MAGGVTVSGVEGCHERCREGEVGFLEIRIRVDKLAVS